MDSDKLKDVLEQLTAGAQTVDSVLAMLGTEMADVDTVSETMDASVDLDRQRRCGYPEVVYAPGKTPDSIVAIFHTIRANQQPCLATRLSPEQAAVVLKEFPEATYNAIARTIRLAAAKTEPLVGRIAVVSAGTSDRPVAEEALETLLWMGVAAEFIQDVGVAGPQRLIRKLDRLTRADAVIVAAGMEGALPSVVAGYVSCPVIAVPTSVGYGTSFGGLTALLSMLNSCAANVAVVNIDAGFRAGYLAGMIAKRIARLESHHAG